MTYPPLYAPVYWTGPWPPPPGSLAIAPAGALTAAMEVSPATAPTVVIAGAGQAYVTAAEVSGAAVTIAPLSPFEVTATGLDSDVPPEVIAASPAPVVLYAPLTVMPPEVIASPAPPLVLLPPGAVRLPPQVPVFP